MDSLKKLILILLIAPNGSPLHMPKVGKVFEDLGVVIEPSSVVLHHESFHYTTLGVSFDIARYYNRTHQTMLRKCTASVLTSSLLDGFQTNIDTFFNSMSTVFTDLGSHYCEQSTLDCFLEGKPTRERRQAVLLGLGFAGLAAAGYGLYHHITDGEVDDHVRQINRHVASHESRLSNLQITTEHYEKINDRLIVKMYSGFSDLFKELFGKLCQSQEEEIRQILLMHLDNYFYQYKNEIYRAMDGHVSDFMISLQYVKDNILSLPVFKDSAYTQDPGLFYASSKSVLIKADKKTSTAYFLVSIPIIRKQDISPLYKVTNFGWDSSGFTNKIKLPENFYYLSQNDSVRIISVDLANCFQTYGIFLCPSRYAIINKHSICLENLVKNKSTSGCSLTSQISTKRCEHLNLKGGVILKNCVDASVIHNFRGVRQVNKIRSRGGKPVFVGYSMFSELIIGDHSVSSRPNLVTTKVESQVVFNMTDWSRFDHLMIPGVEHDLDELERTRLQSLSTPTGYWEEGTKITKHYSGEIILVFLLLLAAVLLCIFWSRLRYAIGIRCLKKKQRPVNTEFLYTPSERLKSIRERIQHLEI
nr:hypothetical protein [Leveillula taurica associated rhabdo-like virus 1]